MSSFWGWTDIVLEGEAANSIYALLCRAKEECASEERDYCSKVIHTAKGDFCFAFGLEDTYEDNEDDYWIPAVRGMVPREDVFKLISYPFDRSSRYFTNFGTLEYEIPAQVEGINPGAFVGCVNLEKVKIWGTVCDVELSLGVASVSLNQADLIEELKKGERLIRIIRSPF